MALALTPGARLDDVYQTLANALVAREFSYSIEVVEDGFTLNAAAERFRPNGESGPEPTRFSAMGLPPHDVGAKPSSANCRRVWAIDRSPPNTASRCTFMSTARSLRP